MSVERLKGILKKKKKLSRGVGEYYLMSNCTLPKITSLLLLGHQSTRLINLQPQNEELNRSIESVSLGLVVGGGSRNLHFTKSSVILMITEV